MRVSDNGQNGLPLAADATDITIGELLGLLAAHTALPIVFHYNGATTRPGYHVTEVKSGQFAALDCGANPECWTEIFVQLWDVNEAGHCLTAGKFSAIIRKVSDVVALDGSARLTFEVSDGRAPMQLYRAALPRLHGGEVHVDLLPRPASCKPRDRWLEQQRHAQACCEPAPSGGEPCCGPQRAA